MFGELVMVSAFFSLLYYFGVLQLLVKAMARMQMPESR